MSRSSRAAAIPSACAELEARVAALTAELQQAREQLRDSTERHALVSQAVAEGIYDWNIAQNRLWVSPRLIELFGWEAPGSASGERPSQEWNARVHPQDFDRYRAALRAGLKGEAPRLHCEYRIRLSSGEYRWVEDHALPVRDARGWAVRLVGAISDVTRRKQREQELREALAQQTATAEVLQVVNSSPGDLGPVFAAILDKAMQLCGTAYGHVLTYDGDCFHRAAVRGEPGFAEWSRRLGPIRPPYALTYQRIVAGEDVIHADDVAATAAYRDGNPTARALVDIGGCRTLLTVALRREGGLLGALTVYRREVDPFTEREIGLLRNFAAQAVIAMENARLLNETREALEQQTATAEILRVISSSSADVKPTFDAIANSATRLCEADFSAVARFEDGRLHLAATSNISTSELEAAAAISLFPRPPGRDFVMGRAFLDRRPVHVEDVLADPEIDQSIRSLAQSAVPYRTLLAVPVLCSGEPIGAINLLRRRVEPFTERQIGLVQTFADQAVIAIENARLITETREALEQQTATAEVLQVINSSPGDLAPVFDAMLEKALRLCGAAFGMMNTWDGERFHAVANHGLPPAYAEFRRNYPVTQAAGTTPARIRAGENVIQNLDLRDEEPYRQGDPHRRALVDLGGARSHLAVALRKDGALLGFLVIYRQEVRPFTDKQVALLQNFAAQAVIAMENARLLTETREALEQQTATAEVLGVINASPGDLTPVFDAMLEKAVRLCEAETAHLLHFDGTDFSRVASLGVPPGLDEILPIGQPLAHVITKHAVPFRMLAARRTIPVLDLREDESVRAGAPAETQAAAEGIRSVLFVPLLREADVVGCFVLHRMVVRAFADKEIALVESFAAQAVIAMDNARLLDEIRRRQAELRVTFDNMGDGVAMFDADHRLAAWNRNFQRILDLPDRFVAARPTSADYVRYLATRGEYGAVDVEAEVQRLVDTAGTRWASERTRPDGSVIEVRHNPVPGGGFVLIYSDVTERKLAEKAVRAARDAAEKALGELKTAQASLIHAEKMASLGQLTAGIAHEIKNPLNFINNFADLSVELLGELKQAAEPGFANLDGDTRIEIDETIGMLTGNLGKIAEHGRRADGIVKSMLAHSRGTSGERQPVDVNALVEEALNLAYHGARAQDQTFNITMERDFATAAPVELVPQDLMRVFLNLIGNGFHAARKRQNENGDPAFRPVLTVSTRDFDDAIEIRVRDNGTGIPAEHRDKLFQPFFTTKPTGEGTGLGLSISWDIVTQQHGGTIAVDSEVGAYTEFTVRLPRGRQTTTTENAA